LRKLTFHGKVTSGEGNGRKYLQLHWVLSQIKEKLGYTPYLGTLNLTLTPESAQNRKILEETDAPKICPAEGYCAGLIFSASINGLGCAVVLPQVKGYAERLLELIAPINLREALNLKDGDSVLVTVRV
jgi:riboflavin kinase, archaea type